MARQNEKDIIKLIQTILSEHEDYWKQERANLKRYRDVYENEFWSSSASQVNTSMIRVETADCFSYVEGFIASLFSRNPAVVVGKDAAMIEGTPDLAQEVANRFLFDKREHLENGS